jgi:hypothetical protein
MDLEYFYADMNVRQMRAILRARGNIADAAEKRRKGF